MGEMLYRCVADTTEVLAFNEDPQSTAIVEAVTQGYGCHGLDTGTYTKDLRGMGDWVLSHKERTGTIWIGMMLHAIAAALKEEAKCQSKS